MREFIYKAAIITFIFIIAFEFTLGRRIDPISENFNKISNEQGRKELINKIRKEMRKGLEKEYILNEEDRILINNFIKKISSEIKNSNKN